MKRIECRDCGREFTPYPNLPGYYNQCGYCGEKTERSQERKGIERLGGNMIYLHKTGGEIEIKPMSKAKQFAAKTKRFGAGVTKVLTESKLRKEMEIEGVQPRMFEKGEYTMSKEYKEANRK